MKVSGCKLQDLHNHMIMKKNGGLWVLDNLSVFAVNKTEEEIWIKE